MPLAGGPAREVLHRFVATDSLSVPPDSRQLLFGAGVVDGRWTNSLCDLPDCARQRELPGRSESWCRWTPDGRGLACVHLADAKNVWVHPIVGGAPRQLTRFTDKDIADFAWSSDGARLAITRSTKLSDRVLIRGFR